jgi:uncharacterized protein (DUF2336 family)
MATEITLLKDIEAVVTNGNGRRGEMLRRVTDLFIVGAAGFSDEEVTLFDDVILRLAAEIEVAARALLAVRLAPIPNAPPRVIRTLAFDDAIDVAGPVLTHSERLDETALIENAKQKGQDHLFAISRRKSLSERITDVLVERGDQQVVLSTAENRGARFSDAGFMKLVERADGDDRLSVCVGSRPELPPHLFKKLLGKASEIVRTKLMAAYPHAQGEVSQAVAEAAGYIQNRAVAGSTDYSAAKSLVESVKRSGQLGEAKIQSWASEGRREETVAALALMCRLPIAFVERAMVQERVETILILAKAVGLSWATVKAILLMRAGKHFMAGSEIAQSLASYERLKATSAGEILRFYRRRAEAEGLRPA